VVREYLAAMERRDLAAAKAMADKLNAARRNADCYFRVLRRRTMETPRA